MYARRALRSRPRRVPRRRGRKARKARVTKTRKMYKSPIVNTASIRENYTIDIVGNVLNFYNSFELADVTFDRAQTVAQAYQEYRMKYIKLTFRPSADTFPVVAGNTIPQLYFMLDKANAIPTTANLQTFLDMGCRPIRFDDRNIVKAWKPTVLTADKTSAGASTAAQIRTSPWLSTNANAGGNPAVWSPSTVDHLGCVFYVTKVNTPDPLLPYKVDVETVFEFRKPLWRAGTDPNMQYGLIKDGVQTIVTQQA